MPLDLRGFVSEPNQWAGLYHLGDKLEKNRLRQQQLALMQQSKRTAATNFLENYLDPKDFMSGTNYDPMIIKGLQDLKQQGAMLAASGVEPANIMMALGSKVNKLSQYSINAKAVNKQVDDQIKLMQESGLKGYDYGKLKDEAMKSAFYTTDSKGQTSFSFDNFDPNTSYIQKAIQDKPELVTNDEGFNEFAKKADTNKILSDVTTYTPTGDKTRNKVHLISQNYMVPEVDEHGVTIGFVPKHQIATDQNQTIFHDFQKNGQTVTSPVRLLDENIYDKSFSPGMQDYIRGLVKQHIKEYTDATGKEISIDSPQAKQVGLAIAYDMLNADSRKKSNIEYSNELNKPSQPNINLRIQSSQPYMDMIEEKYRRMYEGKAEATGASGSKYLNPFDVVGGAFNGNQEILQNKTQKDNQDVFDLTSIFQGGGLKAGRGANFHYKGIYFNPDTRSLVVDKQAKDKNGLPFDYTENIPEDKVGNFLYEIAQSNGVSYNKAKELLEKMGYKNGRFTLSNDNPEERDVQRRLKWNKAFINPLGESYKPNMQ